MKQELDDAEDDNCLIPCEGIYADVSKENVNDVDHNTPGMKEIFEAYDDYKNQFYKEIDYPAVILGIYKFK